MYFGSVGFLGIARPQSGTRATYSSKLNSVLTMSGSEVGAGTLFIEPFYGGSHKQLVDLLLREFGGSLFTLPATKWHWRMRVSALHFSLNIPPDESYRTLFASSVLNLCELVSLRPDLASINKVLYFHENQLVYPTRKQQDRDFQYGYNQILSCLVADTILFNSHFNLSSFLDSISTHLRLMPDHRPQGLANRIQAKCRVLYFPLDLPLSDQSGRRRGGHVVGLTGAVSTPEPLGEPSISSPIERTSKTTVEQENIPDLPSGDCDVVSKCSRGPEDLSTCSELHVDRSIVRGCGSPRAQVTASRPLHILWPHRWEHDKGPDEFSSVLRKLLHAGVDFQVSILGAHTNDIPASFEATLPLLGHRLLHRGHLPREEYWTVLHYADVVVSTAQHEFFGVAMLEAVYCGCYPLCPNRLVYPELYPGECLYNTEQQLFKRLRRFCHHPHLVRESPIQMDFTKFTWDHLKSEYLNTFRL